MKQVVYMMALLIVLSLLLHHTRAVRIEAPAVLPTIDISWEPYPPKYTTLPPSIPAEQALVSVPQDYFSEYVHDPQKRLNVRVRRFLRGSGQYHIWIIPGGPGGHSNATEASIGYYFKFFPKDAWIYLMDHRGTGKSSKSKEANKFKTDIEQVVKNLEYPPQVMSPRNAAMDIIAITNFVKEGNQKWYLFGESYGSYLAYVAYRLWPKLFAGVLLDGFAPFLHLIGQEHDLRMHIMDNCARNEECSTLIDPASIPQLSQQVQETSNACIEKILDFVDKEREESKGKSIRRFNRRVLLKFHYTVNQATLVAYLQAAITCTDLHAFEKALDVLIKKYKDKEASQKKDIMEVSLLKDIHSFDYTDIEAIRERGRVKELRDQDSMFLLDLIQYSEKKQEHSDICKPSHESFLSFCEMFPSGYMEKLLGPYLYEPKQPPELSAEARQVIIVAAKTDTQTVHDLAKEEYDKMQPEYKSFLSFNYAPHCSMGETGCEVYIMNQLVADDKGLEEARQKVKECVDKSNDLHKSWLLIDPDISKLWDKSEQLMTMAKPSEIVPAPKTTGGFITVAGIERTRWQVYVLTVLGSILIPGAHAVYIRCTTT